MLVMTMMLLFFKKYFYLMVVAIQSPSHVQLCDPMKCCTLGSFVLHYLPEFGQIHVH